MNVDEKIHIEIYNPLWKSYFNQEKLCLGRVLEGDFICIEHIGSTAVPDMTGKPIIDILVGVLNFPLTKAIIQNLEHIGYEYMEKASVIGRAYFVKRTGQPYNVHVVEFEKEIWKNNLLLRNYLISHKDSAQKYAQLKKKIVGQGVDTLLKYSALKADFIEELLQDAHCN